MSTERVEFEQSVEGLFRGALAAHEDPDLVDALRKSGLDLTRKLAPAYPAAQFATWLRVAARHRYPALDEAAACREVGKLAVQRGLRSTMLGSALLGVLKMLGVRRSLQRLGRSFRNGNNYIEAAVVERGPLALEVTLGPVVVPPAFYEGVLEAGPRELGAREVKLSRLSADGERITYLVEWTE